MSRNDPFSTVIASNASGINFTDGIILRIIMWLVSVSVSILYTIRYAEKVRKNPEQSLVVDTAEEARKNFLNDIDLTNRSKFTLRQKLSLLIFVTGFIIMIYGVQQLGWYFTEISVTFLGVTYLLAFISGLSEKNLLKVLYLALLIYWE